ncbi:hypothetical protein SDC9_88777 [bioreactor metagenome]|uniref:HTH marR-type domain-containing protein n=1 Tax=bioreactor metagenome TaxID=1076179 RepID=A0A644ZMI7_9ZZZZ
MDVPAKEFIFGSIFLLANRLQALGDSVLEEITLKQWFLLVMIHNMDQEQPSATEIAEFIGSTRQNVRKMLDALAARGYVTLTPSRQDRRSLCVGLTEQTRRFFAESDARGDAFLAELFSGVDDRLLQSTRQTFELLFTNMERMTQEYGKNGSHL